MSFIDRLRGKAATAAETGTAGRAGIVTRAAARLAALPRWAMGILAALVAAMLYWGIGGIVVSDTDGDVTRRPGLDLLPPGGSVGIATAAMLIEDALDKGWTPDDSVLAPSALLEDMPAFQRGEHAVLVAFARALNAAADGDPDLADAADALGTAPDRGWLHGEFPFIGGSAEARYADAAEALTRYNRALADSGAPVGGARRLALVLGAMDRALGQSQDGVAAIVDRSGGGSVDAQYHQVRGAAFASTMLLRGLRDDHAAIIRDRELAGAWVEAIDALDAIAGQSPFGPGRTDLVEQGYFLFRAREQLRVLGGGAMP